MGAQLARSTFELTLTIVAIGLLYPQSAPLALGAAVAAVTIPLAVQPWLAERDLRQRTHGGALTRFYLDALLGVMPVRAHGAERSLGREQEALLVEWSKAGQAFLRTAVTTSGVQLGAGFALAAAMLFSRVRSGDEGGGALLLAYWALNIPMLAQEIAQIAWQYPMQRNLTLRLMEPLGALEDRNIDDTSRPAQPTGSEHPGARIDLKEVSVRAGGHTILDDVSLSIAPGTHVAIVGASGAGKSTLVSLLLGWHQPSSGTVAVDGQPLTGSRLDYVRRQTAWVDPAVQLWNRSLVENLEFGCGRDAGLPVGRRIAAADLRKLIEQLPDGLQTPLGEGGALVSGGEGQRVRFGRGLGRPRARLVVLDEPFRGLERDRRATLLQRAREHWRGATVLCVTHDITETAGFDRILVVADGRVVEDGMPSELLADTASRYRRLLDAESELRRRFERESWWRVVRLDDGKIVEGEEAEAGTPAAPRAQDDDDYPRHRRVTV
jgi:ATP-binding cassette subfamily B protein